MEDTEDQSAARLLAADSQSESRLVLIGTLLGALPPENSDTPVILLQGRDGVLQFPADREPLLRYLSKPRRPAEAFAWCRDNGVDEQELFTLLHRQVLFLWGADRAADVAALMQLRLRPQGVLLGSQQGRTFQVLTGDKLRASLPALLFWVWVHSDGRPMGQVCQQVSEQLGLDLDTVLNDVTGSLRQLLAGAARLDKAPA